MKRFIAALAAILTLVFGFACVLEAEAGETGLPFEVERFWDVPDSHWAYESIHYFRYLGITQGIGNNEFGLGQPVKKSEFIAMLVRLMDWKLVATEDCSFSDVSRDMWYHPFIETAVAHGAILKEADSFSPDKQITRLEIAEAIVRALGYGDLAKQLGYIPSEFADVAKGAEYTNIVKDFGISGGVDGISFLPGSDAKKEEAVAMLIRMYERLNLKINELHAFYAIKSFGQAEMMQDLDSVSFGWSRLEYDADNKRFTVATDGKQGSDFFIPGGYSEPIGIAKRNNLPIQLNLFASDETKVVDSDNTGQQGIIRKLLADSDAQVEVISQIVRILSSAPVGGDAFSFDGVVIDFENLRGEESGKLYGEFLARLKTELVKFDKKLYVAVHPKRGNGQPYYDGYDYRTIGSAADKVILMAHDYNAIRLTDDEMARGYNDTPLTPISEVYYALKAVSDKDTGVADLSKVWLQLSFDAVQWKMAEGKVINKNAFRPSYEQIRDRMTKNEFGSELSIVYSEKLKNPRLTYHNSGDGTNNIIWYEDGRSVNAKIELAKMFGINGVSLWRLGNIPDFNELGDANLDVWQTIKIQKK